MNTRKLVLTGALLAVALVASGTATLVYSKDKDDDDQVRVRAAMQRGEVLPLARILEIVAAQVPGDVIKVELESKKQKGVTAGKGTTPEAPRRLVYEIKVLTATGLVREVKLDAKSGEVLEIEDD